jgi:hypothetical protein
VDKLAYLAPCRNCTHEVYVAYCSDGRWRVFDKTEMPAGSAGSWAWRKRRGMQETDLTPGHPLHYCYMTTDRAPSHTEYAVLADLPVDPELIRPAPSPSDPADVVHQGTGPAMRWTCRGCGRLTVGRPSHADGNRWYCRECVEHKA